ncbi:hypothetical protein [Pseudomonas sp. SO81]|uniref:hypothetical protein n=1 Tax=Pseudomonas sp. SO81 TaxID=2983246 RepID=UPI0025A46865|nr:hypothetical protein [Pseudomonas sp. SO81]WJN60025.1 hypothetical protein OH686_14820 [Pseudomonas sp. SO81]
MIRPLFTTLTLACLLSGCTGSGQNALLGDMLSRAMQETSLSGTDQGLAVKAVQVAAQSAGNREQNSAAQGGVPAPSAEPAAEDAEVW